MKQANNGPGDSARGHMRERLIGALWMVVGWARWLLRRTLMALLALVIVFEEWGWRPLAALLASFARWRPWAWVEERIAALPPYPALVAFSLPSLLILPLKLVAVWLIANGRAVAAAALFIAAKVVGTALVARLFQLTRPALMQLAWFAWAYNLIIPWKDSLAEQIRRSWAWRYGRMVKDRMRRAVRLGIARWRPAIEPWVRNVRDQLRGLRDRLAAWLGSRRPGSGDS